MAKKYISLKLTDKQKNDLEPLFEMARQARKIGAIGMVIGQATNPEAYDKRPEFAVGFVSNDRAEAIIAIMKIED